MYEELVKRLREHNGWALNDTLDEAADAIEDLENKLNLWRQDKIRRWIPVMERLPEKPGYYIVYLQAPESEKERWKEYGIDADGSCVTDAYYNDKQRIWQMENDSYNTNLDVVDVNEDYAITHWQPLPEPPKEET